MWIYDGEEWTEEGVDEREKKTNQAPPYYDEYQPELEVVEIPNTSNTYTPPPPMP